MRIAIEGCCHGQLDDIYGTIRLLEQREGYKIDLVLICGDFQSLRNKSDMNCMAVPDKYKEIGTFWKYYSGQAQAPYPTIFIGGNHEASNYLWELYHGGWVCDNIYYLGHAGVINFGGLRIGGISGISKGHYDQGHYEISPYSPSHIRSAYYVREYDVKKLLNVSEPVDIFLSHDWPRGVERYGDLENLMRRKEYFISEILSNSLGSHPNELLLSKIQPTYWFSAHLHVHYAALVNHDMYEKGIIPAESQAAIDRITNPTPQIANPEAIDIDLDADLEDTKETAQENTPPLTETTKFTKFLSLDKCLPRREFLQVVEIPSANDETGDYDFYYDLEWLAITRAAHPYLSTSYNQLPLPPDDELKVKIQEEKEFLEGRLKTGALDLKIPHNFEATAPAYNPHERPDPQTILANRKYHETYSGEKQLTFSIEYPFLNPQTVQFCKEIDIVNKINPNGKQAGEASTHESQSEQANKRAKIESEIVIDVDEFL